MRVDLPEPEGPTRAANSPSSTVKSMPRSACTAVPLLPNTLVSPRVSMMLDMGWASTEELRVELRQPSKRCDLASTAVEALRSIVLVVLFHLLARGVLQADLLVRPQPGEHLDALEGGDARVDRHHREVVLPVIGEPNELVAPVEPFARLGDERLGQVVLEPVGDGRAVAALQRLERDRQGVAVPLAQDLDVRAHAGAESLLQDVDRNLDLEDLDLVLELGGRRDEAHLAGEGLLGIGVEGHPHRLADAHLGDVHLVEVDAND